MRSSRTSRRLFVIGFLGGVAVAVVGCNTILDNKQPTYDPTALSTDPTQPAPTATATTDPGGSCAAGTHQCNGACVPTTDPIYGCGSATCEPCSAPHATTTCAATGCAIAACDRGFADCNGNPADGCEVDLSKATSCGSCNAVCPPATPICAPTGETFQCGTGCPPSAPLLCGTECVAPLTSPNHCGRCDVKCADVANATVTCESGACKLTCKAGYHACVDKCALDTDPLACGPACTACTVPANARAVCALNACTFACNSGYGDCNKDPKDGCEANFATDSLNCGLCGRTCPGGKCVAGGCVPLDAGP